ncbi:unnamed protein product [Orchesella dallaii]|uniref:F-box domain-containing protein n=1 Tax=Orchesella dallaii TaxID=48710 RepID=A0ABP1S695_9HEXA
MANKQDVKYLKAGDEKHDTMNPFHIDIVNEKIFSYLSAPDLQSCMRTTPTWETYLKPTRKLFLFEMVLPFLLKKINKKEFLTCRLVCQNKPHDNGIQFESPCKENIQRFLKDMDSHRGNPLVGRKVMLMAYDVDEYWNGWRKLLERFGKQVRYVHLQFDDHELEPPATEMDRIEARLMNCLTLLPNLKYLCLDITGDEQEEEFEERLPEFLNHHTLPKLQLLETFYFPNDGYNLLINSIVKFCCSSEKMKRLYLDGLQYDLEYRFPNLEEIECVIRREEREILKENSPFLKKATLHYWR